MGHIFITLASLQLRSLIAYKYMNMREVRTAPDRQSGMRV